MFTDIFENIDYGVTSVDLTLDDELKPRVLPIIDEGRYGKDLPEEQIIAEWLEIIAEEDNEFLAGEPDLLVEDYDWGDPLEGQALVTENLSIEFSEFRQRMKRFQSKINNASSLKVVSIDGPAGSAKNGSIIKPQRKFGVILQRVVWHLNDGQTITAVFEVEGADGTTLKAEHVLSSFIWKVNGIDITRFLFKSLSVDDERGGGRGLTERQLAQRLGRYVEQNAENFAKKKAGNDTARAELDADTAEVDRLAQELDTLNKGSEQSENKKVFQEQQMERLNKDIEDLKRQIREAGGVPDGDDEEITPPPPTDETGGDEDQGDNGFAQFELDLYREFGRAGTPLYLSTNNWAEAVLPEAQRVQAASRELLITPSDLKQNLYSNLLGRAEELATNLSIEYSADWSELFRDSARHVAKNFGVEISITDQADGSMTFTVVGGDEGEGEEEFDELDPENYEGRESIDKLVNHPSVTRTLTNLNNALVAAGMENLNPTIFGRSPSAGGDVETLRTYFKELVERSATATDFGGSVDLDDGTGFIIEMLNNIGATFFSEPIYNYMQENGLGFFDLYEISGTINNFVFHLDRENLMTILSQIDTGETEEEEEETGGASSFEAGTYEYWANVIADEARTQTGTIYSSINSAATMLLRYHNQVAAATNGVTYQLENMESKLRNMIGNRLRDPDFSGSPTGKLELPDVMKALDLAVTKEADELEMDPDAITKVVNNETFERRYNYNAADLGDNGDDDVEPDEVEPDEIEPDEVEPDEEGESEGGSGGGMSSALQDVVDRLMSATDAKAFEVILDEIYEDPTLEEEMLAIDGLEDQLGDKMAELASKPVE